MRATVSLLTLAVLMLVASFAPASSGGRSKRRPNVLFIAIDDLNDWTGFLGGHPQARTPNLDRLAARSVVFERAYCPAPVCGPSRTALMYGVAPHRSGSYGHHEIYRPANRIPEGVLPMTEMFRRHGYRVAGCGKIFHYGGKADELGWDEYYGGGKALGPDGDHAESFMAKDASRPLADWKFGVPAGPEAEMLDRKYVRWTVEQLGREHEEPFFLAVGFKKPHLPWVAPERYFDLFDPETMQLPATVDGDLDDLSAAGRVFAENLVGFFPMEESDHDVITERPDLWKRLVRAYLACVASTDDCVGQVLAALDASPYADDTIVVLWGDHGWHLGEKEHWRKMSLWEDGTRTPLLVRAPGVSQDGARCDEPVTLQDLYPTLVDLCGLETKQALDGHSLKPLLADPDADWPHPALMSHGPGNFAVRTRGFRYIRYADGSEELYDAAADPNEWRNLAAEPRYAEVVREHREHVPEDYEYVLGPRWKAFEGPLGLSPPD